MTTPPQNLPAQVLSGQVELPEDMTLNVNTTDHAGNTALHWAAGAGKAGAVSFLLEQSADLHAKNSLGDTPLHRAVWRDEVETADLLLCADDTLLDVRNRAGKRPYDLSRSMHMRAMINKHVISRAGAASFTRMCP